MNPYNILGINSTSSEETIESRYRTLLAELHEQMVLLYSSYKFALKELKHRRDIEKEFLEFKTSLNILEVDRLCNIISGDGEKGKEVEGKEVGGNEVEGNAEKSLDDVGKKQIYVLRTHFINKYLTDLYSQLQNDFGADSVYMILDTEKMKPEEIPPNSRNWDDPNITTGCIIRFSSSDATKVNPMHIMYNCPGFSHRAETVVAVLYRSIKAKYEYMWLIEYDVFCKGSYGKALEPCNDIECDFLSKGGSEIYHVRKREVDPGWCWWDNLFGDIAEAVPLAKREGCFFPVNRFSVPMLKAVDAHLGKGTGFCEVYFPCLCVMENLSYVAMPQEIFGDFAYRPSLDYKHLSNHAKENKLYHPTKIHMLA